MSRAGSRNPSLARHGMGRLAKNKIAILVTAVTRQLAIQALDPKEWDEENEVELNSEVGHNILLLIPIPGRNRPMAWNLSAMTSAELNATRDFFNHLFNLADPIIRERDKVAQDAFDKGDDTYQRVYRPLPQFVARPWEEFTNSEGLLDGSPNPPEGSRD